MTSNSTPSCPSWMKTQDMGAREQNETVSYIHVRPRLDFSLLAGYAGNCLPEFFRTPLPLPGPAA